MTPYGDQIQTPFGEAEHASMIILAALQVNKVLIGHGMLGAALTVGRLYNPTIHRPPEEEAQFVEHLIEWVNAYFATGGLN